MDTHIRNGNDSINTASTEAYMPTSETSFTVEEEDAFVTLIVVVFGIIVAMVVLFSMGIFIDCRHQEKDSMKRKKLRLKMLPFARRGRKDDMKTLASNMYPNGVIGSKERDDIV
ncbi:PREDICTED: uncharacterized protein LOC105618537 [Atta cephalotes]|uniref:Uncharacterized protein n=2 Tax=Atta TaxID=12956 RepID=A0A158ND51_ATTCE|nr:PREDICTED: uncharacterized protein LOC105618537 [Atta cephalotes]XP_018044699.1 PREDICTED: uncharacterized protein LOC108684747 [Atta colombica]